MNGQGWFMNGQGWLMSVLRRSRHVAEVSQAFLTDHRSIHQMSRFMPSVRRHRTLRHTLRVQVGRAAKVQHPIVTNPCNTYS